jgi:hypothetical protein
LLSFSGYAWEKGFTVLLTWRMLLRRKCAGPAWVKRLPFTSVHESSANGTLPKLVQLPVGRLFDLNTFMTIIKWLARPRIGI